MTGAAPREGLLDTSVVLLLSGIEDPSSLPEVPHASAVTLAELSVGSLVARSDAERAARQAVLQQFEVDFDPLPFDDRAARAFGRVAASLRGAGRKVRVRSDDAMIAAIALAHGLPLYTANPEGFRGIDGLEVRVVKAPTDG
jgi:predicted nucleic acid-binding protein